MIPLTRFAVNVLYLPLCLSFFASTSYARAMADGSGRVELANDIHVDGDYFYFPDDGDGICTLEEAIANLNDQEATYSDCEAPSATLPNRIIVTAGEMYMGGIEIARSVTILAENTSGGEDPNATLWGGGPGIRIDNGAAVKLKNIIVRESYNTSGGSSDNIGGGVYLYYGSLTMTDCMVYNNRVGNSSTNSDGIVYGGGIAVYNGDLTLINTAVFDNEAEDDGAVGGGIYVDISGTATIINSTITGNSASGDSEYSWGGGIASRGDVMISHSTITNNQVTADEGDVYGGGLCGGLFGDVSLKASIVADNVVSSTLGSATGPEAYGYIYGTVESYGYNLFLDTSDLTLNEIENPGTDITGEDPMLAALGDNGGDVYTQKLKHGSPAINAGICTDIDGETVDTDARGEDRDPKCDIGAYEYQGIIRTGFDGALRVK